MKLSTAQHDMFVELENVIMWYKILRTKAKHINSIYLPFSRSNVLFLQNSPGRISSQYEGRDPM